MALGLAVDVDGLSRRFGSIEAVSGVTFQVPQGELFGIVGPDGAGKTTTLRMLAGVLRPTTGDARIADVSVARDPEGVKRHIAYMSQRFGLYGDLTVRENIEFYADLFLVPKDAQAAQRDRATGQTSLFELTADEGTGLERPLPSVPEMPVRERLRWEKELLGLYLSEHPMGEIAEHVGPFVTAYSTDLGDESRCMECHQGRESTISVTEAISQAGVTDDDAVSEDLGFRNIHYFAAAATKYGTLAKGGFEYDGKTYSVIKGFESYLMLKKKSRFIMDKKRRYLKGRKID